MFDKKILPDCFVTVAIPVRNEALHLRESLASFLKQVDLNEKTLGRNFFEIILLANNCSDNSFQIARQFQSENKSLNLHIAEINTPKKNANSGFIRRLLMQKAYERLITNHQKNGIILTTDGDTQVADNWIAANIFEVENGADAVGGRILFSAEELIKMNFSARNFHLIDEKYRLLSAELESHLDFLPHDSSPRHHQHFNGSFAVTTAAYNKAGGIPEVRFLEDVAFYQSLLRIDCKFRHSPLVRVHTSARETGRTEAGLSTQINDWINLSKSGKDFLVESADTLEKRFKFRGKLRLLWKNLQAGFEPEEFEIKTLADTFNLPFKVLKYELLKPRTFGSLLENIYKLKAESKITEEKIPLVPVEKAVEELEKELAKLRHGKTVSVSAV